MNKHIFKLQYSLEVEGTISYIMYIHLLALPLFAKFMQLSIYDSMVFGVLAITNMNSFFCYWNITIFDCTDTWREYVNTRKSICLWLIYQLFSYFYANYFCYLHGWFTVLGKRNSHPRIPPVFPPHLRGTCTCNFLRFVKTTGST